MAMDSCSASPTGIPVVVLQAALAALVHRSRCLLSAGGSDSCSKFTFAQIGFIVPLHVNEFLAFYKRLPHLSQSIFKYDVQSLVKFLKLPRGG